MADDAKHIFVTVGTTSFDKLIKTVCDRASLQVFTLTHFNSNCVKCYRCLRKLGCNDLPYYRPVAVQLLSSDYSLLYPVSCQYRLH